MDTINTLLLTDVYKMGHMEQYKPGITKVYSYLCARSDKEFTHLKFFGLRYYIEKYLKAPILPEHAEEFINLRTQILGSTSDEVKYKVRALAKLGYWPLKIKAAPEGMVYPVKNVLLTITNTHPDFYWCVGFVESLLLKVWFPTTVATISYNYWKIAERYYDKTVWDNSLLDFAVHDFGYRSDSSEESAAISGAAHLLNFKGSDTVPALPFMNKYYSELEAVQLSVPASEHSVMCSFGKDGEIDAYKHMLTTYPTGIVSIVSDTYSIWDVCNNILPALKEQILSREGKVVIRPDSGDPETVLCGDAYNPGVFELLEKTFGASTNHRNYKELNSKIGVIYGDGITLERYESILARMESMKLAASNLVVGVGGLLRRGHRDTLGFALKATYVEDRDGGREIFKDPITDSGKKSHKGLLSLEVCNGKFFTKDQCTHEEEQSGLLKVVYER